MTAIHTFLFVCIVLLLGLHFFAAFNTSFDGSHFTQESVLASLIDNSVPLTLLHRYYTGMRLPRKRRGACILTQVLMRAGTPLRAESTPISIS